MNAVRPTADGERFCAVDECAKRLSALENLNRQLKVFRCKCVLLLPLPALSIAAGCTDCRAAMACTFGYMVSLLPLMLTLAYETSAALQQQIRTARTDISNLFYEEEIDGRLLAHAVRAQHHLNLLEECLEECVDAEEGNEE